MSDFDFTEGDEYELEELPDSDLTDDGTLESNGDGTLAGIFGDQYVEFEWAGVRVTDVEDVEAIYYE